MFIKQNNPIQPSKRWMKHNAKKSISILSHNPLSRGHVHQYLYFKGQCMSMSSYPCHGVVAGVAWSWWCWVSGCINDSPTFQSNLKTCKLMRWPVLLFTLHYPPLLHHSRCSSRCCTQGSKYSRPTKK